MKSCFKSRITVSILCVLMLVSAAACAPNNADGNWANSSAQPDMQIGTPFNTQLINEMEAAQIMKRNRENYEKQMEELRGKYEQSPNDETIAFDYAEILFNLGNFSQSQEILKPLLAHETPSPQAIYLSAQIEYLTGHYAEAERLFDILIKQFSEFKEKAECGLEYVYYQTNQYSKAQNLSIASIEETGIGSMMRAFGNRNPYQVEWIESDKTVIRFLRTDPLPLIQAEIAGQLYNFVIDTGAGETYFDASLASSLGIKTIAAQEGTFAGGVTAKINYGILDSITLNGVQIKSVPVNLLPSETMGAYSAFYNNELAVNGVIGIGVFKQFLVTMDYPAGQLILSSRDGQNSNALVQDENAIELPFALALTHLMISNGDINGKEVNIFFDSGLAADAAILLPNDTLHYTNISIPDTESIAGIGGGGVAEMSTGYFNVDTFILGNLPVAKNIRGLYGVFPEKFYFDEEIGIFIDSLISHNFLKAYKWTMNFDSLKMTFSQ